MFFIMGITNGRKEISYNGGMLICPACQGYTSLDVFVTYMCLTIFFIPVLRWGKRYVAQSRCCESFFEIERQKGRLIEKGESIALREHDLTLIHKNSRSKRCGNCGFETAEDFSWCPKCGKPF